MDWGKLRCNVRFVTLEDVRFVTLEHALPSFSTNPSPVVPPCSLTIGKAIGEILAEIRRLYKTASTNVSIAGESGTGKELIARAIHFGGSRANRPFIPVNCSAIPRELAESLFFGHLKGAFTGATSDKKGCFELADRGTLLLDEIGDVPL